LKPDGLAKSMQPMWRSRIAVRFERPVHERLNPQPEAPRRRREAHCLMLWGEMSRQNCILHKHSDKTAIDIRNNRCKYKFQEIKIAITSR
jgi:hypothetical protein